MKRLVILTMLVGVLALFLSVSFAVAKEAESGDLVAQWAMSEDSGFEEAWDTSGDPMTAEGDAVQQVPDSIEGWNRFWFNFNDGFYFHIFKPLAQGYSYVIPEKPRGWVENFFTNLMYPVRFVNSLLQGKFETAGLETSKFIANTFIGLGGLADVTEGRKVRYGTTDSEDLGQTLGVWGFGNGTYVVWPFLGPSTARDSVGMVGDHFLKPQTYLVSPWHSSLAVTAYEKLNYLSLRIGEYETLKEGSLDPYVALKSAYIRLRAKKVSQ